MGEDAARTGRSAVAQLGTFSEFTVQIGERRGQRTELLPAGHQPHQVRRVDVVPGERAGDLAVGQVAGTLTREDVDASDLMRLMAGGEEFSALTSALTDLHSELGER